MSMLLCSCIMDKECKGVITLGVRDKNYGNVKDIPVATAKDESLPFNSYVSSLAVQYDDNGQGRVYAVTDNGPLQRLRTDTLPAGTYELTAIGNLPAAVTQSRAENIASTELHPGNTEHTDIYVGHETIQTPASSNRTIMMNRAKGLLIVILNKVPANIIKTDVMAEGIYSSVDRNMNYSGNTNAIKTFDTSSGTGSYQMEFMLAPSITGQTAKLSLIMYDSSGNPANIISNITVDIARNMISMIKAEYNTESLQWEVWLSASGEWIQLHDLDIL